MTLRRVDIVGAGPLLADIGEGEDRSDYRPVPRSDEGNEGYEDQGMRGFYTPSEEPFKSPAEVKWFAGYGADAEDLQRGYHVPDVDKDPAFDKVNYAMRSTLPKVHNENLGNTDVMPADVEFRSRNMRTRGFLTRPRIPTER